MYIDFYLKFCGSNTLTLVSHTLSTLQAQLSDAHAKWSESEEEEDTRRTELALSHSLHLIGMMVSWRNGSRIAPGTDLVQVLKVVRKIYRDSKLKNPSSACTCIRS